MTDIPEGFVPHDGGPCPVPLDSKPSLAWGDGWINDPCPYTAESWTAGKDCWQHQGPKRLHIIAYKVETDR